MNLLTDTHTLIWATDDPSRLSAAARQALFDPANSVAFSVINPWEMAIKVRVGRLSLTRSVPEIVRLARLSGFGTLTVRLPHALQVETLPLHHHDPFDRLLVAQCIVEGFTLVTCDPLMHPYGIPILW